MLRDVSLLTLLVALLVATPPHAQAQSVCPTTSMSDRLICVVPQVYGPAGLILPNEAHSAHFANAVQERSTALTAAVGTALTSLRLASPASGIIFTFDRGLGVVTRSSESFGPILGERAETIGRHRLFVAATYQFFPFSTLDGIDLKKVPAVFTHEDGLTPAGLPRGPSDGPSPGLPGIEREYITTTNRIDLKVHQVTFYGTFGITNRIDVSAAIPIVDVRMGITSNATIDRSDDNIAQPLAPGAQFYNSTGPLRTCSTTTPPSCSGFFHYFDPLNPATSLNKSFSNFRSASGIGDVVFRVKGTVLKRERAAVAFGGDLRIASGDEMNFLGSGATGFKPFIAASYRSRISPHANIGYEFNGSSILAGNLTTGAKGRLPDQFFYSGGVDVGVTKKLTAAVDLLGQRLYGAPRVSQSQFVDVAGVTHTDESQLIERHGSYNMNDFAVGAKFSPAGNFLITGNVMFKLDDGGLRAKIVPLVGLSYTF